jgi:formylglycine-generating enzyme required for sulfatase activity
VQAHYRISIKSGWSKPESVVVQDVTQSIPPMVSIPNGTFQMGSTFTGDELPVHSVTIQEDAFQMSMTEVTQRQYKAMIGSTPSYFTGKDNYPVENVTWYEAAKYCNRLSDWAGLQRCYDENTWVCDFTKNGYRLPTEAEWEYACRGEGSITMAQTTEQSAARRRIMVMT